jgi:hypothetical protein
MPAHEEGLTLANAAALGLVLFVGRGTWVEAKRTLRGRQPGRRLGAVLFTTGIAGWLLVATALGYVSWRRTEGGLDHYADWAAERWNATVGEDALAYDEDNEAWRSAAHPRVAAWINAARGIEARFVDDDMRLYAPSRLDALAPVDLEGVALVPRPADWRSHDVAQDAFRDAWCDRKDHGQTACADFIAEREDDFENAWEAERAATLDNLPQLLRAGADLRAARLQGAFAPRIDLAGARLEGADLVGARLEGAFLFRARLEGADLVGARLEGANFWLARLEGADLSLARLEGADLSLARLEGADLRWARLEGAVLSAAEFTGTTLNQRQIAGAIGDADTVLPRDDETRAQLYVWSCWEEPPPTLEQTLARYPEFAHQDLRERWLCNGRPREQVGRPAPEPEEAPENGSGAEAEPAP